ncbi:MAG: carbohydrate binding family 9 domain-containing protein, partial [Gemmatimonadetes bacterium]|nr:carbohydrate binding family 9 domain-containing protein [Gemmatimonadota bacterium]
MSVREYRRRSDRNPILSGALIALWLLPVGLSAQNGPAQASSGEATRSLSLTALAQRAEQPPVVDGSLDEAVWQDAPVMTDFVQRDPFDGQPASERTEVRILFDDDAIFVGVWAWDEDADAIIPGDRIRDTEVDESDAIVMAFDTYNDDQNAFIFGTTPSGIEYDGQVANEGQGGGFFLGGGFNTQQRQQAGAGGGFNKNWDGSWTVATTRDGAGWYAEFRIPFNTLRYGSGDTWGFNIARQIRRRNEESFWAPVPREFNLYRLTYAGDLAGLELPFRRLGSITPYMLGSTSRDYAGGQTSFDEQAELGGEAKFQLTQGLTLDATYNTDFAQVEVDDQQVNLTRFSLLFPEKRPFFLENAGFFTVGA